MKLGVLESRSSMLSISGHISSVGLIWSLGIFAILLLTPHLAYSQAPSRIAYAQNSGPGTSFDIFTIGPDGTGAVNLTNDPANDRSPSFSPDGSKIVFVSDRDGFYEIYSMNADGSDVTQLTDVFGSLAMRPTFSPDGTKIMFALNNKIWTMNPDGSDQDLLTTDTGHYAQPRYSPDGLKISFVRFIPGDFDLFIMNSDTSGQTRLTFGGLFNLDQYFSPDGLKTAFTSFRDGDFEIYTMNPDGSDQQNITNSPGGDFFPVYSPDGTKIAFVSSRDGTEQIYLMDPDGTNQTQITFNPTGKLEIDWGPEPDSDGDGVPDASDVCPGTELPDVILGIKKNRYAANSDGQFVDSNGMSSGYSISDTGGCSGSQIIDSAGLGEGHLRFGITQSALLDWIASLP